MNKRQLKEVASCFYVQSIYRNSPFIYISAMQNNTPEKAVQRAGLTVTLPSVLMFFGIPALTAYLCYLYNLSYAIYVPIAVVASIIITQVFYSWRLQNWRLWAYANTDDIEELKRQAIVANVMYAEGSFLSKLEIKTAATAAKVKQVEQEAYARLHTNGLQDDETVPESTAFYYSITETYFLAGFAVLIIGLSIWLNLTSEEVHSGKATLIKWVGIPIGLYMVYDAYKRYKKREHPVLLFSNEGLYVSETDETFTWDQVEGFAFKKSGKNVNVVIDIKGKKEPIEFQKDFGGNQSEITYLHRVYTRRYNKANAVQVVVSAEDES